MNCNDIPHSDVFEEWHRRWTDDPTQYLTEMESLAEPDDTYGIEAARYFFKIADEMRSA
jgi:hypothetical protein